MTNQGTGTRDFSPVSVRDILYIVFKYKREILTVFFAAIFTAITYILYVNPIYEAETKVLILLGKEKFSAIQNYNKESYNILFQERGQNINNEIEIISDKLLSYRVLDRLEQEMLTPEEPSGFFSTIKHKLKTFYKSTKDILLTPFYYIGLLHETNEREAMANALSNSLDLEFIEDTDIIKLSFRWTDPEAATLAVNTYAEEYVKYRLQVLEDSKSQGFYLGQSSIYEKKLQEAENQLDAFRSEFNISNLPLQKELLLRDISENEIKYNEAIIDYENARISKNAVVKTHKKSDDWIETPDVAEKTLDLGHLDQLYFELLAKKNELSTTHAKDSRVIQNINYELKQLRDQKATSLLNYFNVKIAALEFNKDLYEKSLEEKRKRLNSLDANAPRLDSLTRAKKLLEQNYLAYEKKAEDLRISDDLDAQQISSIRIISKATTPNKPIAPRKTLIMALSAFLGIFFGFGYSVLAEYFSHAIRNESDVNDLLGLRVLASITDIDTPEKSNMITRKSNAA